MAYKVFETEDEYNEAFKERVERERKKYADYDDLKDKASKYDDLVSQGWEDKAKTAQKALSDLKAQYADYDKTLQSEKTRADNAEKTLLKIKVAQEYKLPAELADRITGDDEKAMKQDAETLAKLLSASSGLPRFTSEPRDDRSSRQADKDAALSQLLKSLNEQ